MKDCKILVVHDYDDLRSLIVEFLVAQGFPVEEAANGHEALQKMRGGFQPDVILSDLLMPVMDGYQLNRELKRHPDWAKIPVIVTTAAKPRAGTLEDIEAVLQGTLDAGDLLECVRAACRKKASA